MIGGVICKHLDLYDYGVSYSQSRIYVIQLEGETLSLFDTVENYGNQILLNDNQPEIVSYGSQGSSDWSPMGGGASKTVYVGKYNFETQEIENFIQCYGTLTEILYEIYYSNYPDIYVYVDNEAFNDYGLIYQLCIQSGSGSNLILSRSLIRTDETLSNYIWYKINLFSGYHFAHCNRLGNVLGDDKLILTGYMAGTPYLELIELETGNSLYNQNMPFNAYYVENGNGKPYFIEREWNIRLYEIDESSIVSFNNATIPHSTIQLSNFPNPFNPSTEIRFQFSEFSEFNQAEITIYNLKGQKVKTFPINLSTHLPVNALNWNGDDDSGNPVTSGIYLYRLKAGNVDVSRKCLLLK